MSLYPATWGDLDAANLASGHYNKHPQHEDYYKICHELELAKSRFDLLCDQYEFCYREMENGRTPEIMVNQTDVMNAQEYLDLCEDASMFMWILYHQKDCSCTPDGDTCLFCKMSNRHKEWKARQ